MKNKFIFLDVGDTFLKLKKPAGEIYRDVLEQHKILSSTVSIENAKLAFQKAWEIQNKKRPENFRDKFHHHPNGSRGWWQEVISSFFHELNIQGNVSEVYDAIFLEFDKPEVWEIDPSLFEIIRLSGLKNYGLGIISNWDDRLRNLLQSLGILSNFDLVFISSEFGYEKPSPFIFEEAEKKSGMKSENIIYAGDKYELDFLPAWKKGWDVYLIGFDQRMNAKERMLSGLGDLIPLI